MKPSRKNNRLETFDYSQNGAYFVTICVQDRKPLLSRIENEYEEPTLTVFGEIVQEYVQAISVRFSVVRVDRYILMPDHIHLLVSIEHGTGDPSPTLGEVVGWLKYQITKAINLQRATPGGRVFQRSYYDHVIRNKEDYDATWEYIENNPTAWKQR